MSSLESIREEKQEIAKVFLQYFANQGYRIDTPAPLATQDETVLFTNDTITPWKGYVQSTIPAPGLCMMQPCLRLRGLKDTITEEAALETRFTRFIGAFNSLGILTPASRGGIVQEEIIELLQQYGIPQQEVEVLASADMEFLDLIRAHLPVRNNTQSASYYQWKYGMPGITGSGATFGLLQHDGEYKEIGQLIELRRNGEPLGYEFGFGLETFHARRMKSDNFDSWTMTHLVPPELRFKVLLDMYSCFGTACTIPPEMMGRMHQDMFQRLGKAVVTIEDICGIDECTTNAAIAGFAREEHGYDAQERIFALLQEHRTKYATMRNNLGE